MSLTLLVRRVLRHFPRLAPRLMNWAPGGSIQPMTFADLAERRAEVGAPIRSACSCAVCRHARESVV